MEIWLFEWGVTTLLNTELRMRTSLLNSTISISVAIIAAANTRRHHMTKAHLLNETARLESVKESALASIKNLNDHALKNVKTELSSYVHSMQGANAAQVLAILKTMIDKVVQPLSRKLENEFAPWAPPEVRVSEIKVDWYQAFKSSLKPGAIQYVTVPILMTVVAIPTVLARSNFLEAFIGLGFSCATGILTGKILQKTLKNRVSSTWLFLVFTLTTGFTMGLSTLPITRDYQSPFGFLILGIVFYPFASAIISLLSGADEQLAASSIELKKMTEELEWNVARVRETQYRSQKALARTLHGSVQAKLSSSYLELEKLHTLGQLTQEKLHTAIAVIRSTIDNINTNAAQPGDLMQVIEKVRENWAAIAKISTNIAPSNLLRIQGDSVCMAALLDVIPELVFNGIKHGGASEIDITVDFINDRVVRLVVSDNGVNDLVESKIGLGSRILDESSIAWSRERIGDRTITAADFAFSLDEAI